MQHLSCAFFCVLRVGARFWADGFFHLAEVEVRARLTGGLVGNKGTYR